MLTLNGTVLRVVTFLDNAYTYDVEVLKIGEGQNITFELVGGYSASILQELSNLLDFKIEHVTDPPNLAYDFSLAVQNYSVDMFASSFFLSEDHNGIADPTFVTGRSRIQVFLNRAFEGSTQDVVVAPLAPSVWMLLAFSILFVSSAFCLAAYLSERLRYSNALFQIVSVFLLRDAALRVRSTSSRIIQLTASITIWLVMSAYSAKLYSIGAVKVASISTLAALIASNFDLSHDRGYGNKTSLQHNFGSDDDNPIISAIDAKAAKSPFRFDTFESAMKEVHSRPFAYIIEEETAYSATENALGRLPCELGIGSIYFGQYYWSMFMRKGFEHGEAINSGILLLAETGVLRKFARHWIPGTAVVDSASACSTGGFTEFSGVYFSQLKIAFIVFIAEALCTWVVLVLEIFKSKID